MEQSGRVHNGEDRGERRALRNPNQLVLFIGKEIVEPQAYFPVGKEGSSPPTQRGVEAQVGDDCCKAIVVNVIEEPFHIK